MKTEIPKLRKVQYYYTDLLFLLPEGHIRQTHSLQVFVLHLFSDYQPNIWNYFFNCIQF